MSKISIIFDFGILGEKEVEVKYQYSPGTPDVMYLPNGDPGYPGDPAELEILDVTLDGIRITQWLEGNDAFETTVFEEAAERHSSLEDGRDVDREEMRREMKEYAEDPLAWSKAAGVEEF